MDEVETGSQDREAKPSPIDRSAPSNPASGEPPGPASGEPLPTGSGTQPPSRRGRGRWLAGGAIAAALVLGLGGGLFTGLHWSAIGAHTGSPATPRGAATTASPRAATLPGGPGHVLGRGTLQAIAHRVDPAIVNINTIVETGRGRGAAAGTGIILTSRGQVLTNNHVVEGAVVIRVTVAGRAGTYPAHVIGVDPSADVALIQVEGVSGLPTARIAHSWSLQDGQAVVALGNALGRGGVPSETAGTITALDQSITAGNNGFGAERLTGMIQINARILPGDSGGPLVDTAGQVIGMITAGAVQGLDATASTVGYAIPSDAAQAIVDQIRSGQAGPSIILGQAGYIGVSVRDLDPATASQLGLNVASGALVVAVQPGSPAARAGLSQGAVITSAAGSTITSVSDLGTALHAHSPGQRVQVTWVDQTGRHTAGVTLATGPVV